MCSVKYVCYCILRFGFVDFSTHEEAKEAVGTTVEINGQTLNLEFTENQNQRKRMFIRLFIKHAVCKF